MLSQAGCKSSPIKVFSWYQQKSGDIKELVQGPWVGWAICTGYGCDRLYIQNRRRTQSYCGALQLHESKKRDILLSWCGWKQPEMKMRNRIFQGIMHGRSISFWGAFYGNQYICTKDAEMLIAPIPINCLQMFCWRHSTIEKVNSTTSIS